MTTRHAAALALVCEAHPDLNAWVENNPATALEIARLTLERFPEADVTSELTRRLRVAIAHGSLTALEAFRGGRA